VPRGHAADHRPDDVEELRPRGHGDPHDVIGGAEHARHILGGSGRGPEGDPTVELRLDTRSEGEWTVLEVDGEIDLSTAPNLRSRVDQLIRDGVRSLVVDLEHVGFLDSSGLSALVAAMKHIEDVDGRLAIVCQHDPVLKVFMVTGLDRVFAIHGSLAEATAP
jgi:anti-sigma B factor antagonist